MTDRLIPFRIEAGIQRDGTRLTKGSWSDGQWTRFQRGYPRKMGGYIHIIGYGNPVANQALTEVPRGMILVPVAPVYNIYVGTPNHLYLCRLDKNVNVTLPFVDVTPVTDFVPSVNNLWDFDFITTKDDAGDIDQLVFAHAAQSLNDIDNTTQTTIFWNNLSSTAPFKPLIVKFQEGGMPAPPPVNTLMQTAGGVVVLYPYIFIYDEAGRITILSPNDPFNVGDMMEDSPRTFHVTSQKIVAAKIMRGGNSSPSGLFWSTDSLIRCTFIGGNVATDPEALYNFRFDTVSDQISIMSSRSVIEYDGLFFWAGTNRFYMFNGVVQALPNDMSTNFFFENFNFNQRQKCWATKIPHFNEIIFFAPSGTSEECDMAVVFNLDLKKWSDFRVKRGCGYYNQNFVSPIWADNTPNPLYNDQFALWQHEAGYDEVVGTNVNPIQAYIQTNDFSFLRSTDPNTAGIDKWVSLYRLEPDIIQRGDITLTIAGRDYPRSTDIEVETYTITDTTEKVDLRQQGRFLKLRFESNVINGYYEFGDNLLVERIGDGRQ